MRNFYTGLYSGCTGSHCHQSYRRVPFSTHLLKYVFVFLIIVVFFFLFLIVQVQLSPFSHCHFPLPYPPPPQYKGELLGNWEDLHKTNRSLGIIKISSSMLYFQPLVGDTIILIGLIMFLPHCYSDNYQRTEGG